MPIQYFQLIPKIVAALVTFQARN